MDMDTSMEMDSIMDVDTIYGCIGDGGVQPRAPAPGSDSASAAVGWMWHFADIVQRSHNELRN